MSEPADLGTARLVGLTLMHQHSVVPESLFSTRSSRESIRTRTAKILILEHGKRPSTLAAATLLVRPSHHPNFSGSILRRSNEWQSMAFEWCVANPSRMLVLTSTKPRLIYHITKRGEYVEFGLPTTATALRNTGSAAMARRRF
jgi:hypothetical protein